MVIRVTDDGRHRQTTITWAGQTVTVEPGAPDEPARFVTDVAVFDALARQRMLDEHDAVAADYLDFDGADDLLRTVFGTDTPVDAARFVPAMRLHRIGLYPQHPDAAAVFDYTLGRELTDHVVAVTFGEDGTLTGIAVES